MRYLILTLFAILSACKNNDKKVLVFTKTAGYRHISIEEGVKAMSSIGASNEFSIDTTSNSNNFNEENLKKYSAIIFLSTTGNLFDTYQQNALERYIQAGGGFVGIHAATDAEYHWPWYNKLVGGYFSSHPEIQEAQINVVDASHESTKHLSKEWTRKDEWYNFKSLYPDTKKLLTIDENSYKGGSNGKDHPMSWYHEYDGGRSWYTALGHTNESYREPDFLKHILGGINYAIGNNKRDYKKVKTALRPTADRFTIDKLVEGIFFEPTEMTILPNLDVVVAQRRGEIMRYEAATKKVKQIGKLKVYYATKNSANAEEGLMGIQKDPAFEKNGFIYMYYALADSAVNRLSRFYIDKDSVHMNSEKIILDVASQREICCHTGGSIAFSGDGQYLYLSTGDNATPFDEEGQKYVNEGFAPQDDRPGHMQYDARRSSANTNDLRGKILRLKINKDGTYTIPAGNLFPVGKEKTRPEIFVMGNRNPYRISVDPKTNYLYWGEVGPDAAENKEGRGPRGYDEVNVAKKAGNFGWPLFVGNNYAYNSYNYNTGKSGPLHNPENPINDSKNNTGIQELPPAEAAMIYYPYDKSEEFPELATGGRNAMAGPVYYTDLYPEKSRLPSYFNGKLFIYDWIRQWIKVVAIDRDNNIEPFLEDHAFANIIDMEVAPSGEIYLLEYGKGWFSKNSDCGLSRVVYNEGNRIPKIKEIIIDKTEGKIPHTFTAKVIASDPDNDKLKYAWKIGNETIETDKPNISYTIKDISRKQITCTIVDPSGNTAKSKSMTIYAGNEMPSIDIEISGNQSMYFPGEKKEYSIKVNDDTALDEKNIYIKNNMTIWDKNAVGHINSGATSVGESLMASSDCQSCHKKDTTSIGPSYINIAKRYEKLEYARNYLSEKIRLGGSGVWGEGAMAAHPAISENEALQIVDWIMSLSSRNKVEKSLPTKGFFQDKINSKESWNNVSALTATYTDSPKNGATPLTKSIMKMLRPNYILADAIDVDNGFERITIGKNKFRKLPKGNGFFYLEQYDLMEVNNIEFQISGENIGGKPYRITLKEKESKKELANLIIDKPGKAVLIINKPKSEIKDYIISCEGSIVNTKDLILEKIVFNK
jgi:cytochrome c